VGGHRVGVVIPAYNAEATLGTTLASVAAQSLVPQSVTVVDDGSSDDTAIVAERWRGLLPIDVIRSPENEGLSSARRRGIAAATAPLIALLDADDIWLPDHLELMAGCYEANPGLVTADALRWIPGHGISKRTYRELVPVPPPEAQRLAILRKDFVFIGVLFSRDRYEAAGGFRAGMRGGEDWELWIRMIRGGVVVTTTPYPTVLYRLSRTSLSADGGLLRDEIAMLTGMAPQMESSAERAALNRTLGQLHRGQNLVRAYRNARSGQLWSARMEAFRALRGARPVALRAAVMCVAPGLGVRIRDARKWKPESWLRR
jgi:glycosyltransferase involved in cell wall biosynthesis